MNSRLYRLSLLVLGLQTVTSIAISMPDLRVEQLPDGKYRIVGCGFNSGDSFSLQYGQNGLPSSRTISKKGCVEETLSAMTESITEMVVVYKGEKKSVPVRRGGSSASPNASSSGGYTRPSSSGANQPAAPKSGPATSSGGYTRPGGSSVPSTAQAPATNPVPAPQQPAPAPVQLKKVSEEKIRDQAERAAKQFAERVLRVYGSMERARRAVRAGLDEANSSFERYGGDITRMPEFATWSRSGQEQGRAEGAGFGMKTAESQGTNIGASEADARFTRAAEQGRGAPDLTFDMKAPILPDPQEVPSTDRLDMRTRVGSQEQALLIEMRKVLDSTEIPTRLSDKMIHDHFTLVSIWAKSYQDHLGEYFADGSNAFSTWAAAREAGLIADKEIQQWLSMVEDSSSYAQAREGVSNRDLFRRYFVQSYTNDFNNRWRRFVSETGGRIAQDSREVGKKLFNGILIDQAKGAGHAIGYARAFNKAAQDAYRNSFDSFARMGFDNLVAEYQKSAVLSNIDLQLVNYSARDLAPGDKLALKIKKALNKGMKPFEEQARVSSEALTVSGEAPAVRIAALSKISEDKPVVVENFAQVAAGIPFNKGFTAEVKLGKQVARFEIKVTVKGAVAKLAEVGIAGAPEAAKAITQMLETEWKEEAGSRLGSIYNNGDTKLDEVVKAIQSLDAAKQTAFATAMKAEIRKIYPETRPDGWFDASKDDFDYVEGILNQIGWSLLK